MSGGEAPAVQVRGLVKSYSGVRAVRSIEFHIRPGEIFALLGPNGAGKTTTVEILEGYRHRDGGEVSVLGYDPRTSGGAEEPNRDRAAGDQRGAISHRGGERRMYAGYYPHPRPVDEVIEFVGLTEKRDAGSVRLSGGQQRRLEVAIALAGDPDMLFLDEPTTGFDPSARHEAWEVVKNLANLGKTVLLTTHYMDEAQYLADRVAVIADGRIVAEGPPETLADRETASPACVHRPRPASRRPRTSAQRSPGNAEFAPDDVTSRCTSLPAGQSTTRSLWRDSRSSGRPWKTSISA